MAEVDVVSTILIACPVHRVAAYASNPDNVSSWYVNIASVEWQTPPPLDVGSRVTFVAHFLGRRLEYTYEIVEFVPEDRLIMRTAQGPFPMETTYRWESLDATTTRMTLRNRGRPAGFSALMTPVLSFMIRRQNHKDLRLLRHILETATAAGENKGKA